MRVRDSVRVRSGQRLQTRSTPSQLVIGRLLLSSNGSAKQPSAGHTVHDLSRREKQLNTILSHFWKRWQTEYLTELRVHHNCNSSNREEAND